MNEETLSPIYFVADDFGLPASYGYTDKRQAELAAETLSLGGGWSNIAPGIDVEKMLGLDYEDQ